MAQAAWIREWVDVPVLKRMSTHASGSIAAILSFWAVGWVLEKLLPLEYLHYLELIDRIVLIGVFVFLALEIFKFLGRRLFYGTERDVIPE